MMEDCKNKMILTRNDFMVEEIRGERVKTRYRARLL